MQVALAPRSTSKDNKLHKHAWGREWIHQIPNALGEMDQRFETNHLISIYNFCQHIQLRNINQMKLNVF